MKILNWNFNKQWTDVPAAANFSGLVRILALAGMVWALAAAPAGAHSHSKGHGEEKPGGMKMGGMKMGGCERMVNVTSKAEMQMGGAHFKGAMPKKGSMPGMKGMKMDGDGKKMKPMKMGGDGEKMAGMGGAHSDHDAKGGGVLFMAPNEMHHIEGTFAPKCGFQVFIYNAFTKSIGVSRFRAFIKIIGEVKDEDVEAIRFLNPNGEKTLLHAELPHGLKQPFEVELYVKFPESEEVEVFNFAVDEQGKIS